MTTSETLFTRAKFPDGTLRAVTVSGGRIAAISTDDVPAESGQEVVDLGGRLILPGFVEGHIHLDTSFFVASGYRTSPAPMVSTCTSGWRSSTRTWRSLSQWTCVRENSLSSA
jgi:cytosine/adenosine deaminase-related metal-dependent hydrolase